MKQPLLRVAEIILVLWVLHNIVGAVAESNGIVIAVGGAIGAVVGDLRVWLSAVGVFLLWRRDEGKTTNMRGIKDSQHLTPIRNPTQNVKREI
jgi:hypothetical protein